MKLRHTIGCLIIGLAVAVTSQAGFVHFDGQTAWNKDVPAPATCWIRDSYLNVVWTSDKVLIYADTPRTFNYTLLNTTSNDLACLGFWTIDTDGIIWPRTDLETVIAGGSSFKGNQQWFDVEWLIDEDGILWPKE